MMLRNLDPDENLLSISAIALAWASLGASQVVSAQTPASDLESEFLLELVLDVDAQIDAGHTRIAPVTGGTFGGPRIKGTVLPGGADWITQASGHSSLDVRITLETDGGWVNRCVNVSGGVLPLLG